MKANKIISRTGGYGDMDVCSVTSGATSGMTSITGKRRGRQSRRNRSHSSPSRPQAKATVLQVQHSPSGSLSPIRKLPPTSTVNLWWFGGIKTRPEKIIPAQPTFFSHLPPLTPIILLPAPLSAKIVSTDAAIQVCLKANIENTNLSSQNKDEPRKISRIIINDLLKSINYINISRTKSITACTEKCSIAVQVTQECNRPMCVCRDRTQGLVGGVRAMRDASVRLAVRQLRQIRRLNRALDSLPALQQSYHTPLSPCRRQSANTGTSSRIPSALSAAMSQ